MNHQTKTTLNYFRYGSICLLSILLAFFLGCGKKEGVENTAHHDHDHNHNHTASANGVHEHKNPDETCFICDPSKREAGRLWCKEHGRYENRCWLCHPELEEKDRLYCKEHFLYEDECFLCHPELKENQPSSGSETSSNHDHAGLFCHEHGVPEIECAICQPELAASLEPGENLKVRLPSTRSAEKVGIRTKKPGLSDAPSSLEAYCEVQYNLNTLAKVTPLANGVIKKVHHDIGDEVNEGEPLVELHSAEVAEAKSLYLSALVKADILRQTFEREKRLTEENIASEKDFLNARGEFRTAQLTSRNLEQKLINLGLNEKTVDAIETDQDTSAKLIIRAPFSGTLIERNAVNGEAVQTGTTLFTIADLSSRWLALSVPANRVHKVNKGQEVRAQFSELPGVTIKGIIDWVDTSVDSRSRMVKARALITENADQIKNGMFGEAKIILAHSGPTTIVPRNAIQHHNQNAFVFVQNETDLFSLRRVQLGDSIGNNVQVVTGLNLDDAVVMDGTFIMMSEFLKSRLGAGCAEH